MPTITSIAGQKKPGRYNVYLDGKYAFAVDEGTLIRFGLSKGQELSQSDVENLERDDGRARALGQALNYISHQARSEQQVRRFLAGKDIEDDISDLVVAELQDLHYLDDGAYAKRFVAENLASGDRGPGSVRSWLTQRGIDANTIEDALADYSEEEELRIATVIAEKFLAHPGSKSHGALVQSLRQRLMQKGFSSDVASSAINAADEAPDEERENDLLQKAAEKAWRQKRGLDPRTRFMKAKQQLYRKGFNLDDISAVLEQIEAEDEDQ